MSNPMPPPPGFVHPWYADKPWVRDWVTGKPPYRPTDYTLKIAIPAPLSYEFGVSESALTTDNIITMERQKAAGMAPYVGTAFMYLWYVGVDSYGRQVCSEATIVHMNTFPDDFDPYSVPLIE